MNISLKSFTKFLEILPKTFYFWFPVVSIILGYGFWGSFLWVSTVNGNSLEIFFLLIALGIGSIWAFVLGNGGLLAAAAVVGVVFKSAGLSFGLIALAITSVAMWFGFRQTDREQLDDNSLSYVDFLAVAVILAWAVFMSLGVYQILDKEIAAILMGCIAGGLGTIGAQVKAVGLNNRQAWQFFVAIALVGSLAGWLHGWLTYKVLVLS